MAETLEPRQASRWSGLSKDQRRRERRRLIVEAVYELLSSEGEHGTTIRKVCGLAQLNPRYFYESFESLDDAMVAVFDRVLRDLTAAVLAASPPNQVPDEATATTVRATVSFILEDPRRGRVLYTEALGNEALNRRRLDAGLQLVEAITTKSVDDGNHLDRLRAAMLVGGFSEILRLWITKPDSSTIDDITDGAIELCQRLLR